MDTSNPVQSSDQVTLEAARLENMLLVRQNFDRLRKLLQTEERELAPETAPIVLFDERLVRRLQRSSILELPPGKFEPKGLAIKAEAVQVSKHHPQGVSQKGGVVNVEQKVFQQFERSPRVLRALLTYLGDASPWIEKMVYTGGSAQGLANRLEEWANRPRVSADTGARKYALNVQDILKERLPVEGSLPNWHKPLDELISDIKITMSSDAGPPFFSAKGPLLDDVLKLMFEVVEAAGRDPEEHAARNLEVYCGVVKNKVDRYATEEVREKTRPYFTYSASLQLLFSVLSQNFTKTLKLFDSSEKSWNAYGFSWAHGGAERLYAWMVSTKEGERKLAIYGDDVKMVWRRRGVLYEVNPDFRQMDGSVDEDLIGEVVRYVIGEFKKQHGPSDFWQSVGAIWGTLAADGGFFAGGEKLYTTRKPGGLRTGIVGTTLFDTAKAAVSYAMLLQAKVDLEDPDAVAAFMRVECGLEIKKGTYDPIVVLEERPPPGSYLGDQKFLGARLKSWAGRERTEMIPSVPEEDLVTLVSNCKHRGVLRGTEALRREFDMARGYMVCGAYQYPRLYSAMARIVNETPPEVACMRVQEGEGLGQKPELTTLAGTDFQWPSSEGFPEPNWCLDVYLTPDNRVGGKWSYLYPALEEELESFRKAKKRAQAVKALAPAQAGWAGEVKAAEALEKAEQIRERVGLNVEAEIQGGLEPLDPLKMPKIKKKLVRFRPDHAPEAKEDRLRRVLTGNDGEWDSLQIHQHALTLMFSQYGDYWIAQTMLKFGFRPLASPEWAAPGAETDDPVLDPRNVSKAWPYEARRALADAGLLGGDDKATTSSTGSTTAPVPAVAHQVSLQESDKEKPARIPPSGTDDVSYVTSHFANKGQRVRAVISELSKSPNPRVQARVVMDPDARELGWAIGLNQKLAKAAIFGAMREELE